MVLGILTSIAACPAIIGTTEAVRQGQRQNAKEQHRGQKSNMIVQCPASKTQNVPIHGCPIYLRNHKLYIHIPPKEELEIQPSPGHPFAGYFLAHPDYQWRWEGEGLVSTIQDDPPQLNWIYVDKDTYEVKYGNKAESAGQIMGPWNCTKVDKRMIFEGWEGFMAVKEDKDRWALYFDKEDDGLKEKVKDKRIVEVELVRKERRKKKIDADNKEYR